MDDLTSIGNTQLGVVIITQFNFVKMKYISLIDIEKNQSLGADLF